MPLNICTLLSQYIGCLDFYSSKWRWVFKTDDGTEAVLGQFLEKEAEGYLWCFSLYFSWLAQKYTFLILQSHLQLCVHIQDYYWSPKTGGKVNLEYEPVSFLSCHKQSPRKCYSTRFVYSSTFLDSVFFVSHLGQFCEAYCWLDIVLDPDL